jgi:hypothetical protein
MKLMLVTVSAVLTALAVSLAVAENPAPPAEPTSSRLGASALLPAAAKSPPPPTGEKGAEKLREGTKLLDEVGGFSRVGERVSFTPGKGDSLKCLENLALERIARAIDESQGQRQWVVSGVVTEFKGGNYLLVTKAVIRLQEGETATGP